MCKTISLFQSHFEPRFYLELIQQNEGTIVHAFITKISKHTIPTFFEYTILNFVINYLEN